MPLIVFFLLLLSFDLHSNDIIVKGSDTLGAKMVPQLAEKYKEVHSDLTFRIAAEGSSTGFTNLLTNTCDFGMSSRAAKQSEHDTFITAQLQLKEHIVAYDMIAIMVDETNPLSNLSREQIKGIFTSKVRNWKQVGWQTNYAIKVLTRNTSSSTYKTFQKLALDREPYGITTQKVPSNEAIHWLAALKTNNGISYGGSAYVGKQGLKALKIDGVAPAPENVTTYPLTRNLYFYTTQNTPPAAHAFIEWVKTSPEAFRIIEKSGFIPPKLARRKTGN